MSGSERGLVHSNYLSGIPTLVLNDNDSLDEAAAEVFAGPDVRMTGLVNLCLGFTQIGDAGAEALARSPHLAGLRTLDVKSCGLSPRAPRPWRSRHPCRA